MQKVRTIAAMQRLAKNWRRAGMEIGFVPTMGYLHDGHMSLVRFARKKVGSAGKVVVSIYVNPTQFAPTEDLSKYPRDLKRDLALCNAAGVDAVFVPDDGEMYAAGELYSTYVVEESLSRSMEGASRPTHFRGVTTVVAKLFNIVMPDVALFGEKDYQQAAVLRRMVENLNFPIQFVIGPTRREIDGLAMSSRNKYLDVEQRRQACILSKSLAFARKAAGGKGCSASRLERELRTLISACPAARVDYIAFFDELTLKPVTNVKRGVRVALAVFFGKTRLIDNGRL